MTLNDDRLTTAILLLRAASPGGYNELVRALEEHALAVTHRMLSCSPDQLQKAQGMAIEAAEIVKIVKEAPAKGEKAQIYRMGKQRNG